MPKSRLPAAPGTLEIYLLGPPHFMRDGVKVDLPRKKERALLFYLSMAGRRAARNVLADLLWGGLPEDKALRGLSNAVYRINRCFSPAVESRHVPLVVAARDSVGLNPQFPVFIDALAFAGLTRSGRENSPAKLEEAVSLYRGDFLEGFFLRDAGEFENWVLDQRERLQAYYLSALHRLLHRAREEKDYKKALEYAYLALDRDELQEDIHYVIMQLHWLSGNRAAALRQYHICRQVLQRELGVEPQPKTRELYARIKSAGGTAACAGVSAVAELGSGVPAPAEPAPGGNSRPAGFLLAVNENRGRAFFTLGEYDRAAEEFGKMRQLAASAGDVRLSGEATYLLGLANLCNRNFAAAEENLAGAYRVSLAGKDTRLAVACATGLSLMYSMMGRLEEARKYSSVAQELGRQTSDGDARCHALIDVSRRLLLKGMASAAAAGLEEALLLSQSAGQTFNELFARFFLGLAYAEQGNFLPALEQLSVNLERAQQAGNSFMLTRLPNSIGYVYHELGDLNNAAAWNERGVEICRQFSWPEPLGYSLVNLAFDCLHLGDHDWARLLLREAEELARRDDSVIWRWECRMWLGLGELALRRGNVPEAGEYCRRALASARRTRVRKNMARSLLFQSKIHYVAGDYGPAAASAGEALALAEGLENPLLLFSCHDSLAAVQRKRGNSGAARRHAGRAAEIIKEIYAKIGNNMDAGPFKEKLQRSGLNCWNK